MREPASGSVIGSWMGCGEEGARVAPCLLLNGTTSLATRSGARQDPTQSAGGALGLPTRPSSLCGSAKLARRRLAGERPNHTIQPTALVNEAYMRLANERGMKWQDRSHFLAVAAQLMRFILVDHARKRRYLKRGGDQKIVALDMDIADVGAESVLKVDHAISDLAKVDERKARVVEMRVFAGLSVDESARLLGVSAETIGRDWRFARAWLQRELTR